MIKVDQTIFGTNDNCYSAYIASILEIPIKDVPTFSYSNGKSSFVNASEWLTKNFNIFLISMESVIENKFNRENLEIIKELNNTYHLAMGPARMYDAYHCCVALSGVIVHDTHPRRLGLDRINRYEFLVPVNLKLSIKNKMENENNDIYL